MAYTIWWQDIQGTQGETPHSDIDIYCLTWDGVTDPTTLRPTLDPQTHMPQNYYFVYDCAEDICDYTTYNNASYYGYYYGYTAGQNKVLYFNKYSDPYYQDAFVAFSSDGSINYYNCTLMGTEVVNNITQLYLRLMVPAPAGGDHLYCWTDSNVPSYYGWGNSYYLTTTETPDTSSTLYLETGGTIQVSTYTIEAVGEDYITVNGSNQVRKPSRDYVDGIPTLYSSSTSIAIEDPLFDNNGISLNKTVLNLYQNDSFDIDLKWTLSVLNVLPQSYDYCRGLTYDGTKFMVLTTKGCILTSTDGETWSSYISYSELSLNNWRRLVYGGSRYVALGSLGHVSTSTNGTTWTTAVQNTTLSNASTSWGGLTYANNKFIALSADGYISTSTNGTTWTTPTLDTNLSSIYDWRGIAYNGTKYVAINFSGYISTSTDGVTWTTPIQNTVLGSHSWFYIIYNRNMFVAMSQSGYISRSVDGENWSASTQDKNLGNRTWQDITSDGTKFVVIGSAGYVSHTLN